MPVIAILAGRSQHQHARTRINHTKRKWRTRDVDTVPGSQSVVEHEDGPRQLDTVTAMEVPEVLASLDGELRGWFPAIGPPRALKGFQRERGLRSSRALLLGADGNDKSDEAGRDDVAHASTQVRPGREAASDSMLCWCGSPQAHQATNRAACAE